MHNITTCKHEYDEHFANIVGFSIRYLNEGVTSLNKLARAFILLKRNPLLLNIPESIAWDDTREFVLIVRNYIFHEVLMKNKDIECNEIKIMCDALFIMFGFFNVTTNNAIEKANDIVKKIILF
jgi:hypothetical protein